MCASPLPHSPESQYARIAEEIAGVPGVLAHGLFAGRAVGAVLAEEGGVVQLDMRAAAAAGAPSSGTAGA